MRFRWGVAIVLTLVIPIASWFFARLAVGTMEAQWAAAIVEQYGPVSQAKLDAVRLAIICEDPATAAQLASTCDAFHSAALLQVLAVVSGGLAGILLVVMAVIAAVGRRDRVSLARVFRPGLFVTLIGMAFLLPIQGVSLSGGLLLLMRWTILPDLPGRIAIIPPVIALAAGMASFVATIGVIRAIRQMLVRRAVEVRGIALEPGRNPRLFEEVGSMAAALGTSPPDVIMAGLDPTFFVVDAEVRGLDGKHAGRVLFVSLPLCRMISAVELRAIVGHELGHFRGEDTTYTSTFAPIYGAARASLEALNANARHGFGWQMIPAAEMLNTFVGSFASKEREISRARELEADLAGAEVASPMALASALCKLEACSPTWAETWGEAILAVSGGRRLGNVSEIYVARARKAGRRGLLADDAQSIQHPFDTHPLTETRLDALQVDEDEVADDARDLEPADPAIRLFGDPDALEDEVTRALEGKIARANAVALPVSATNLASGLRTAAEADAGVAAVIALFDSVRGPDLMRPIQPTVYWVVTADLLLAVAPEPRSFGWYADPNTMPTGDYLLAVDVASPGVNGADVLRRGTRMRLVGTTGPAARSVGREEFAFVVIDDPTAPYRLILTSGVGPVPVEHQLAGLLVLPASDPLAKLTGVESLRVTAAVSDLHAAWRPVPQPGPRPPRQGHRRSGAGTRPRANASGAPREPGRDDSQATRDDA